MNIVDHTTYSSGGDIPSKADLTQCSLSTFKSLCFINDGSHMVNHYSKERRKRSECVPPLDPSGRGSKTCLLVRGWGDPIRTTGQKAWNSIYSVGERNNAGTPVLILPMHQLQRSWVLSQHPCISVGTVESEWRQIKQC